MRQRFSIGIQDFALLRESGAVYVDKTDLIRQLATDGNAWFLSRPRRFGKSLLVSTLEALFSGREDLFAGLHVASRWNFRETYPVIRLSLAGGSYDRAESVRAAVSPRLEGIARRHGIDLAPGPAWQQLERLLETLGQRGPRPVVLVDEYDKPVVQVLERQGQGELLQRQRDDLRSLYSVLKDAPLRFLLLTGVTRLTKASVFSELNHLNDISWAPRFATLLGLTEEELKDAFAPSIAAMAASQGTTENECVGRFTSEYDGFRFSYGAPRVFNPFSTILALDHQRFEPFWAESGTPEFLVRVMAERGMTVEDIDGVVVERESLASLDLDSPDPLPLLLQTGYLTILDGNEQSLTLGFPNREVRRAFLRYFVGGEVNTTVVDVARRARALGEALLTGDLPAVIRELQALFKVTPYGLDDATERRYHSVVHAVMALAAAPPGVVLSETQSATGRTDLVVDLPDLTWIFELKRDGSPAKGLAQASRGDYAAAWEGRTTPTGTMKPVRVVCLNFGSKARNIIDWAELPG